MAIMEYARRQSPSATHDAAADSLKELVPTQLHERLGRPDSEIWSTWARNSPLRPALLFTIRCPVLGTPDLRDCLPALSRELVDLMDCGPQTSAP
jgi:hypothetical protein